MEVRDGIMCLHVSSIFRWLKYEGQNDSPPKHSKNNNWTWFLLYLLFVKQLHSRTGFIPRMMLIWMFPSRLSTPLRRKKNGLKFSVVLKFVHQKVLLWIFCSTLIPRSMVPTALMSPDNQEGLEEPYADALCLRIWHQHGQSETSTKSPNQSKSPLHPRCTSQMIAICPPWLMGTDYPRKLGTL